MLTALPLPIPPTANAAWDYRVVFAKEKKRWMALKYTTHEYKAYTEEIGWRITEAKARYWTEHPLHMRIALCFRDARKQDMDNRLKPLLDALMAAQLFKDDSQIEKIEIRRGPDVKGGGILVSVREFMPVRVDVLTWIKGWE